MHLSDLQLKEIINIDNGRRVGNIIDVIIGEGGTISKLVVEERIGKKFLAASKDEIDIYWKDIIKIGDDIILVDLKKNH